MSYEYLVADIAFRIKDKESVEVLTLDGEWLWAEWAQELLKERFNDGVSFIDVLKAEEIRRDVVALAESEDYRNFVQWVKENSTEEVVPAYVLRIAPNTFQVGGFVDIDPDVELGSIDEEDEVYVVDPSALEGLAKAEGAWDEDLE